MFLSMVFGVWKRSKVESRTVETVERYMVFELFCLISFVIM